MPASPARKRTPKQVRNAIQRLDLDEIVGKGMVLHGWRRARAREADLWYRNFLWLCYKHGAPLAAIGKDADDLWHLHILDTRKYAADCRSVFGRFLNHHPLYGEPTAQDRAVFARTKELYRREFKKLPKALIHVSYSSRFE